MNTETSNDTATSKQTSTNQEPANPSEKRPYAVVLYGATSFVGQITAHYLTEFLSNAKDKNDENFTWAIAGRDEEKLNELQSKLTSKVDIIIADSNDAARDRKSTRLNSSHVKISYAVFCLK